MPVADIGEVVPVDVVEDEFATVDDVNEIVPGPDASDVSDDDEFAMFDLVDENVDAPVDDDFATVDDVNETVSGPDGSDVPDYAEFAMFDVVDETVDGPDYDEFATVDDVDETVPVSLRGHHKAHHRAHHKTHHKAHHKAHHEVVLNAYEQTSTTAEAMACLFSFVALLICWIECCKKGK
eukprot:NODE_17533_length_938_cov_2.387176.p1 GENE.NODE_17533_length_938_cov_2.387176~~NODE_17533_length_938_cov_2.387176.p1  ORF type:complete len:209 (+),score=70.21 NODE_17533_length_938_cov_2.387176:90-629(+)